MRTSSRTVALVLFDEVELLDAAAIDQVLTMAGRQWNWRPFRVVPAAVRAGNVPTRSQLPLTAAVSLADCTKPEIIVLPGGYGARRAARDENVVSWLRAAAGQATHLLGIGSGVGVLASAGLLDGVRVAATEHTAEWIAEAAPTAKVDTAERIVVDGRFSTAAASAATVDLALELVRAILGEKQAIAVADVLGHAWEPASAARGRMQVDIVL